MLIEHPIAVIEDLLKLGLGDKGRLEYLKNAIKTGNKIYDSDKEYLKNMQNKISQIKSVKSSKFNEQNGDYQPNDDNNSKLEDLHHSQKEKDYYADKINYSESEYGKNKIQFLITELKKNNSRLMDNLNLLTMTDSNLMYKLELLRINREITSQTKVENSSSDRTFYDQPKISDTNLSVSLKKDNPARTSKLHKFKKHEAMIYASAGFLTLWYADYQNLIDLGPFRNIAMGLSAGAAVAAALFYKKQRK